MSELETKTDAEGEDFIAALSDEALDRDGDGGRGLPRFSRSCTSH